MSTRDPWQLVQDGQYHQALEVYQQLYDVDGNTSHLYNRGLIYIRLGDHASALHQFQSLIAAEKPQFLADSHSLFLGVCYWFLGQPTRAVESWRQSLSAAYTDAAGGVRAPAILLYAAERLYDVEARGEALRLLRKRARRKLVTWPGPIAPYLLGEIDTAELEEQARLTQSERLAERWQCQADFYVALRALRDGDQSTVRDKMLRCARRPYIFLEYEHYIAHWEVQNDFPDPAFSAC